MTLDEMKTLKVGDRVVYKVPFPHHTEPAERIEVVTKAYGTAPKHTGEASAVEVTLETVRMSVRNRFSFTKLS